MERTTAIVKFPKLIDRSSDVFLLLSDPAGAMEYLKALISFIKIDCCINEFTLTSGYANEKNQPIQLTV